MSWSTQRLNDDFLFLDGRWRIAHERLDKRREDSTSWSTFETDYECQSFLQGLANVDRLWGEMNGQYFEGASVRTFDQLAKQWTIYWMDTRFPTLQEQVRGKFVGDRGEFHGQTDMNGKAIDVRFLWLKQSADKAQWEQAYKHPETGAWETNWIMRFTRAR